MTLTPRESEVGALIAEGRSNHKIACSLGISVQTVKVHQKNMCQKAELGAWGNSRVRLALALLKTFSGGNNS